MRSSSSAPKRKTKLEREEALAKTARLMKMGYSMTEIGKRLGVSSAQVSYDQKVIRQRLAKSMLKDRAEMVAEKVEELRFIRSEAMRAWKRSGGNKEKIVTEELPGAAAIDAGETGIDGDKPTAFDEGASDSDRTRLRLGMQLLVTTRRTVTVEGRLPGAEYLGIALRAIEAENKLLGLNDDVGPEKNKQQVVNVNIWNQLAQLSPKATVDTAEDEIEKVLGHSTAGAEGRSETEEVGQAFANVGSVQSAESTVEPGGIMLATPENDNMGADLPAASDVEDATDAGRGGAGRRESRGENGR